VPPASMSTAARNSREPASQGIGPAELAAICWRRRTWFAAAAMLIAGAVILSNMRTEPVYEATATLAIDRSRKAMQLSGETHYTAYEHATVINTERERLLSRRVLERALRESDLLTHAPFAQHPDPASLLRGAILVQGIPESWAIRVRLRLGAPALAEDALRAVLSAYMAVDLELKRDRARGALEFLSQQVSDAEQDLFEAREREEAYREAHEIFTSDSDQNHIAKRLELLNGREAELDQELADVQVLQEQVRKALAGRATADAIDALLRIELINRDEMVRQQLDDLYELEQREVVLAQKYLSKHPRMRELRDQLSNKRDQVITAIEQVVATLDNRGRQLNLLATDIEERIDRHEEELSTYRSHLIQLDALREQIRTKEVMLGRLRTRLQEEQVASRLESSETVMVDPPRAFPGPVNMRPTLWLMAGVASGLLAGLVAAFAAEFFDRRIGRVTDAQALSHLPVLAQIPYVRRLPPTLTAPQASPSPGFTEAFRQLRVAIGLARDGERCRVILCTSPGSDEGKTLVSSELARSLAASGSRVLLLDADLRHPSVHRVLGLEAERGLAQMLATGDVEDAIPFGTSHERLMALPVGERPKDPAELLHSAHMAPLLSRLREEYDYILIDTPPIGLVADALVLAEAADGIVLVLREGRTSKSLLQEALNWLEPFRDRLLGLVYNGERHGGTGGAGGQYYYYAKSNPGATTRFRPGITSDPSAQSAMRNTRGETDQPS